MNATEESFNLLDSLRKKIRKLTLIFN